jgi:glucose-1-phosphate cytidylyltransferase
VKVVILCGGMGTRLREETEYRPKPMVEIGGRPILWHIMKIYAFYGFNDFILCLGYKGSMIKEYFLNYRAMSNDFTIHLGRDNHSITYHTEHDEQDFSVTLADTGDDANTGSRVAQIAPYIDGDDFMVTYGDGLADINIKALVDFHRNHGRTATMMTYRPTSRYGKLQLDDQGHVREFVEKPQLADWISGGFFVFRRGFFNYLSTDYGCVMETSPLAQAAADGELIGYRHDGFFHAMDTYKEHLYLNELWNSGKAPWKIW